MMTINDNVVLYFAHYPCVPRRLHPMSIKRLLLSVIIGTLLCLTSSACTLGSKTTSVYDIPIPSLWSESQIGYSFYFLNEGMVDIEDGDGSPPIMYCCEIHEDVIIVYLDAHTDADRSRSEQKLEIPYQIVGNIMTIVVNDKEIQMTLRD